MPELYENIDIPYFHICYRVNENSSGNDLSKYFKLILHPLSKLTKEIEHDGERFVPMNRLSNQFQRWLVSGVTYSEIIKNMSYSDAQNLFKWHFDVFGLINNKSAVEK